MSPKGRKWAANTVDHRLAELNACPLLVRIDRHTRVFGTPDGIPEDNPQSATWDGSHSRIGDGDLILEPRHLLDLDAGPPAFADLESAGEP